MKFDSPLTTESQAVVQLATLGALAARIEPQLLRRLRLQLAIGLDAGSETELWFSRLVEIRAPTGLVLAGKVLPALRNRLAGDEKLLEAVWRVTAAAHVAASPAIRIEEELTYLGLKGLDWPGAEVRVRELLRRLVRTLVERGAPSGLPAWADRAIPRLPQALLKLQETHMIAHAAALRLGRSGLLSALGEAAVSGEGWSWLAPETVRHVPMSIRWVEGGIEFGPRGLVESHPIDVPALLPLAVHVWPDEPEAGRGQRVPLQPLDRSFVPVEGNAAVVQIPGGGRVTLRRRTPDVRGIHQKLSRVRKPRVNITYEVETEGAEIVRELPFVVGVMGNFAGNRAEMLLPLMNRKFIDIDSDNFDEVMARIAPGVTLRMENSLDSNGGERDVTLLFQSMGDLTPMRVAKQIPLVIELLAMRTGLKEVLDLSYRSDKVEPLLETLLQDSSKLQAVAGELGLGVNGDSLGGAEDHSTRLVTDMASENLLSSLVAAMSDVLQDHARGLVLVLVKALLWGMLSFDRDMGRSLLRSLAKLDTHISGQLNTVMHHPDFVRLEGSWRGLYYLVMNSETGAALKIRMLSVTKQELVADFDTAIEFDGSQMFRKTYDNEFGTPGGEPYGVLIGDYEWTNHPEDIRTLHGISRVAAAAFSPFFSAAGAGLFGFENWLELSRPRDLSKVFEQPDYIEWRSFRETEESRFVALTMPRVLARLPYGAATAAVDEFDYNEAPIDAAGSAGIMDHDHYCWMNTAYVLGARVTNAFAQYGYCISIRGVEGGGKVENLPSYFFISDDGDIDPKCPTEIGIGDRREFELSNLGFLPLCHYKNTDFAVFFSGQTMHKAKRYDRPEASANAAISSRLPYVMATSRFVHYLKVMTRDKIGSFMQADDVGQWLNRWIMNYVSYNENVGQEGKARYPLREAQIEVSEVPDKPGAYNVVAFMRPWLQVEELSASMRVVARIPQKA